MKDSIKSEIDKNIQMRRNLTDEYNERMKSLIAMHGISDIPDPANNAGEAMYILDAAPVQEKYDRTMARLMAQYAVLFLIHNDIARPGAKLHPDAAIKKLTRMGDAGAEIKKYLDSKLYNGADLHKEMKRKQIQFLDFWYLNRLLAQVHNFANTAIDARSKNNADAERRYMAASRRCAAKANRFHQSVFDYLQQMKVATK